MVKVGAGKALANSRHRSRRQGWGRGLGDYETGIPEEWISIIKNS